MDTNGKILDTMSRIMIDAGVLAFELEDERALRREDREALSQAISKISGAAQTIVCWLLETPIDTPRQ